MIRRELLTVHARNRVGARFSDETRRGRRVSGSSAPRGSFGVAIDSTQVSELKRQPGGADLRNGLVISLYIMGLRGHGRHDQSNGETCHQLDVSQSGARSEPFVSATKSLPVSGSNSREVAALRYPERLGRRSAVDRSGRRPCADRRAKIFGEVLTVHLRNQDQPRFGSETRHQLRTSGSSAPPCPFAAPIDSAPVSRLNRQLTAAHLRNERPISRYIAGLRVHELVDAPMPETRHPLRVSRSCASHEPFMSAMRSQSISSSNGREVVPLRRFERLGRRSWNGGLPAEARLEV